MHSDELNFHLPAELIAQSPCRQRSDSRLLHYKREDCSIDHRTFAELPDQLRDGDVLVFNDAKVLPARITLRKSTGGRVEGLFLRELDPGHWRVLLRDAGNAKELEFADDLAVKMRVTEAIGHGEMEVTLSTSEPAALLLSRLGRMPLPPYIKRDKDHDERDESDRENYQTVYAKNTGSVAAPTAGLHFTRELLGKLDAKGIDSVHVTLHVGMGTFKPVTAGVLQDHTMHSERYEIDEVAATALNLAGAQGRRIIAVGTTAARVLESYPNQPWQPTTGETSIFIYPPYYWKRVGALLTNFHLPKSTLVALVAAMVGLDEQRKIYQTAIENKYRFFSYGDAMLIE